VSNIIVVIFVYFFLYFSDVSFAVTFAFAVHWTF